MPAQPLTVAFDMDNVLCNWEQGFIDAWKSDPKQKYREYIPIKDRNTFYASKQYRYTEDIEFAHSAPRKPGFYENLLPMPGALENLKYIEALHTEGLEMIIVSSPHTEHPTCAQEKLAWIKKYLGSHWVDKVFIVKDKTRIKADYLIDDKPLIEGSATPEWEHIIFDMPYNVLSPKRRMDWGRYVFVLYDLLKIRRPR